MKRIFLIFLSGLGLSNLGNAQCTVNTSASPTEIVCGESVVLSAFGSATGQLVLDEDFNTGGFGPGWSSTPGATSFSNPCSPGGVDGTTHAWMDNNTSVPRALTSANYDLSAATAGVTICFDLLFATQGNAAPCEGPDEPDEGVFLQYSIDGGTTWIDIYYFDPNGGYDPQLTNWNNWCFAVPAAAITANTMFQWYQEADSGADYDHWGIDNVQIFMNDISSELVWLHDNYSYGVGNAGGPNPTPVSPTTTTTYTAQMTTGNGAVCTQDITVVVTPPTFNVNLTASPTSICVGSCSTISGNAEVIQDPGGIETYENNEFQLVASGSAAVNINVQGINTNNIYSGLIQNVTINGFSFSGSSVCTNLFGGCDCNGVNIAFGATCNLGPESFTVTLTSPGGCTIILAPSGVATGNYNNTVFVPVGGTALGGAFPTGGPWNPQQPFSNLNGCDPNGVWTLEFNAPGLGFGVGTLFGWSITFDDPPIYQPVCTSWSPTTGLTSPGTVNTDACPTVSTDYTLTVSNCIPGCPTYDEVVSIIVDPCGGCTPPNLIINPLNACSPNTVDLASAIGVGSDPANLTYYNTQLDAQNATNPISSIVGASGTYWVRAEDLTDPSCYLEYPITVTINNLAYAVSVTNEACNAGDGQIALTPNLGVGPYTYSIDGGLTNQGTGIFAGLSAGSYNVLITDNSTGCSVNGTENVGNVGGPSIDNIAPVNPSCPGLCDGSITVTVSGGTPPYSYQWYDAGLNPIGTNSSTITGLCSGNYSVEVSDAGGGTTQLFYDDFESGAAGWTLNVPVAPEGADPNYFEVDDDEGGVAVGGCGIAGNGNATLHITSVFFPGGGAAYDAGGLCGLLFCPESHRRAESPMINTVGQTGLTLNFDFIAQGNAPFDQATVWYDDGGGWTQLGGALFSGTGACAPQGIWTAYSSALPASCENIPNLRVAIRWDNNDDGVGTDPSVAINNIEIVTSGGAVCTSTQFASLVDPAPEDPTFILTDFCQGSANGATGIALPGGTFSFSPDLGDGSLINATTGEITNGVVGTTYTVQYVTNGLCPESMTNTVTVNGFSYTALITDETCGASDGVIDITAVGGTPAYSYSIDNGATSQASGIFNGLSSGNYNVVITDNTGCQATGVEIVSNSSGPTISSITPTDPSCALACDGQITATVTGGTPPYNYQWYDGLGNPIGSNSATITGLCEDNYSVEVTDASGGGSTQLNTNSDFESGTGGGCDCPPGYICNNDAGQVFDGVMPVYAPGNQGCVTGATNYTNSLGANSGTGYIYFYAGADNISTGPYTFVGGETVELCVWYAGPQGAGAPGQNTANCNFSFGLDGAQIGPDVLVPVNTGWTQFCFTVVMTPGNHTFQILSGGAAQYALWFDDFTINDISGGGGVGCPATANTVLVDPAPADPTFTLTDFCEGAINAATGILTPGGTFAFNPNPADGSSVDPITGEVLNGVVGTTYTIEYTTPGSCPVSMTNTVTVNGFTYNVAIIDENCGLADGSINITTNGGAPAFTYSIDNGVTTQGTGLFVGLTVGTYDVIVTDNNGCQATGTEIVSNTGGPSIDNALVTDETCSGDNDGSIDITAVSGGSGVYTYSWDIAPDPAVATVTGLAPGTYTLTLTDPSNGCTDVASYTVNAGPICCDLVIDTLSTSPASCGNANGEIVATAVGGDGNYTYSLNNGPFVASGIFQSLTAGNYQIIVNDGSGVCADTIDVVINEFIALSIDLITPADALCNGANDGEVTIIASGGTGIITFEIDNGAGFTTNNTTGTFTGIPAGNYSLTVTDANGCQDTDAFDIFEPAAIDVLIDRTDILCFGATTGEISITASGGTPAYSYSIDNGASWSASPDFTGLGAGVYSVLVEDANGCQSILLVANILEPSQLSVNVGSTNELCFGNCNGSMTWSPAGGTPPYAFVYNGTLAGAQSINGLCPAVYNYTLTDANGCLVSGSTDILAAQEIIPGPVTVVNDGCSDGCDGSITVTSNTGVNYSIGGISNVTGVFSGICSGNYAITITDANGCQVVTGAVVSEAEQTEAMFAYTPGYITVLDNEVQLINTSFNADSYFWEITGYNNGFSDTYSGELTSYQFPADSGSYLVCLTAINNEGCEDTYCAPIVVQEVFTLYVPNAFTPDDDEFNQNFMAYVHGIDIYEYEMLIFNRWGEIVWENHDPSVGWDGTYHGKLVQDGVYTWKISVKFPYNDERQTFSGHVSILR